MEIKSKKDLEQYRAERAYKALSEAEDNAAMTVRKNEKSTHFDITA